MLLDHRMAGTDGITCLKLIKQPHPEIKVVMLSGSEDSAQIAAALAAGASAYIGNHPDDLASTLRQVVAGVLQRNAEPTRTHPDAIRRHASRAELPADEIVAVAGTVVVRPNPIRTAAWPAVQQRAPRRRAALS